MSEEPVHPKVLLILGASASLADLLNADPEHLAAILEYESARPMAAGPHRYELTKEPMVKAPMPFIPKNRDHGAPRSPRETRRAGRRR